MKCDIPTTIPPLDSAECNCTGHGTCDEDNGTCNCYPGWAGDSCQESCKNGYFGLNCQSRAISYKGKCHLILNNTNHFIQKQTHLHKMSLQIILIIKNYF